MKHYVASLKSRLQQSLSIGVAELKNKRTALVAELDSHLEQALNRLYMAHKDKERVLKDKDQEIDSFLEAIDRAGKTLQLKIKAEPKGRFVQNYAQTISEAEESLGIRASDIDLSSDWATLPIPVFAYSLVEGASASKTNCLSVDAKDPQARLIFDINESQSANLPLSPIKPRLEQQAKDAGTCTDLSIPLEASFAKELEPRLQPEDESHKDVVILELMKSYRELEKCFQMARKGLPLPKTSCPVSFKRLKARVEEQTRVAPEASIAEPRGSQGSSANDQLLRQNKDLLLRLERLERTVELDSRKLSSFNSFSSQDPPSTREVSPLTYTVVSSRPSSSKPIMETPDDTTAVVSRASRERICISSLTSDKPER
jgi:hypothetical protein